MAYRDCVWVRSAAHHDPQPAEAEREYEIARQRGLGVCLEAIRVSGGATVAVVLHPHDDDEAERLMYPSDGELKLSMPVARDDC